MKMTSKLFPYIHKHKDDIYVFKCQNFIVSHQQQHYKHYTQFFLMKSVDTFEIKIVNCDYLNCIGQHNTTRDSFYLNS